MFFEGAAAAVSHHLNEVVERKLETRMEQGAEQLRETLRAPGEAPRFFMEGLEQMFDAVWDDVRDNLVAYLMVEFGRATGKYTSPKPPESPPLPLPCQPLRDARAWVLYTWYPYDRSIWGQLRTRGYWVLTTLSLFPRYGVAAIFWLLLGTLIERSDEYQLCSYILGFKGYQFLSTGLFGLLYYGLTDAYCVTWSPVEEMCAQRRARMPRTRHYPSLLHLATLLHRYACRSTGPGQRPEYVWESACFACEVFAVYTAFLALPYSNNHAALLSRFPARHSARHPATDSLQPSAAAERLAAAKEQRKGLDRRFRHRGGLLRRLFVYDVAVFCGCCAIALVAALRRQSADAEEVSADAAAAT